MAAIPDTSVTYEDLADLEHEFEDVETETTEKSRPLYEKRQKVVSQIPNFWPLVVEQAPPDIDEFIQPSDQSLLLSRLTSLSVSHFEIENGGQGNPRSIAFRWEFAENEYFEDRVLEKKFWYRHADDGWSGLVSEPVDIKWKGDNDLTGGLLGLAKRAWDAEQALAKDGKAGAGKQELIPEQKELKQKIEETGLGGMSFFGWFGFRGRRVSAEESRVALEKLKLRLAEKKRGAAEEDKDDKEEEEEDDLEGLEIFPEGDTLAVTIAEDLWPGAIKYFTQAQEVDLLSDEEFESDPEDAFDEEDDSEPPSKKRKA